MTATMADYNVPTGHVGYYEITTAAGVEDRVVFGADAPSRYDLRSVEVKVLSGTAPVYFRFGDTPATVKGTDCWDVHPATAAVVPVPTSGDTVVRLISSAAAVVSVSSGG